MRRRSRAFETFAGAAATTVAVLAAISAVGPAGTAVPVKGVGHPASWPAAKIVGARPTTPVASAPAPHPNPWLAYETTVDPGSGVQFVSQRTGFALSGQPLPTLDWALSSPAGPSVTWPSAALLVSHNGGHTWSRSLGTLGGFWGVHFLSRLDGWAVGVTALYRTVDGGATWVPAAEPAHALVQVAFSKPNIGVGLTTTGQLVRSADRGSSWHATLWRGKGAEVCWSNRTTALLADQHGGVWRSHNAGLSWEQIVHGLAPPIQFWGWWVELSCAGRNAVELAQSFCEAACGGGVETIVRQSTDAGLSWREVALIEAGAANPNAPVPAAVAPRGLHDACLFGGGRGATLDIRCTSDGGRTFRHARTPRMPSSRYPGVHLQGVNFLGAGLGRLEVEDTVVGGRQPARYQTEVWATKDGGASWQVAYATRLSHVPPLA